MNNRHAILIMAHGNWSLLERLMRFFDDESIDFYIHIDKKAKTFDRVGLENCCSKSKVTFVKSRNVSWGTYDQIATELSLYKYASQAASYRYYHLISGVDVPLVSKRMFLVFFNNTDRNFIIADVEPQYDIRIQIHHNLFRRLLIPEKLRQLLTRKANAIQLRLGVDRLKKLKARFPLITKGHNWCSLTDDAVAEIVGKEEDIKKYFAHTHCADEMYKQIVLCNSALKDTLVNEDLREMDWSQWLPNPKVYTMSDYSRLIEAGKAGKMFARKFDETSDIQVVDKIYDRLQKE